MHHAATEAHPAHTSRAALAAWSLLALAAPSVPWLVGVAWLPTSERPELSGRNLWDAAWPVLLGLVLATAAWLARRVHLVAEPPVLPAGDVLVPVEAVGRAALAGGRSAVTRGGTVSRALRDRAGTALARLSVPAFAERGEERLAPWRTSGAALLGVAAVVLVVGWLT